MPISQAYGVPHAIWIPVGSGTVYDGSCMCIDMSTIADTTSYIMMPVAAGHANITNYDVPFGAVIGNNLRRPTYNSTGLCDYITYANPHASTTEYVSTGGHLAAGAREPMVKVTLIDPTTILRTQLVLDAPGTPPTVVTGVSAASTTGVALTTGACDVITLDGYATIYFRTGGNAGQYRKLDSASTTVHEWNLPTYADTVVGDTAVVVNVNMFGLSRVQLAATYCNCFDIDDGCGTNDFLIDVIRLNLAEVGNEYVEFRWNITNFFHWADRTASA